MNRANLWVRRGVDRSVFLVLFLSIGASFSCVPTESSSDPISANEENGLLTYSVGDQNILSFATEQILPSDTTEAYYARDGFIHPLYSPNGVVLTEGYPRGHSHQHGVFHAWTRATVYGETIDFWNQQALLGTVELRKYSKGEKDGISESLDADLEYLAYVQMDTVVAAKESWTVKIQEATDTHHVIDVDIAQTAQIDSLIIQDYVYGGFGFRANEAWNMAGTDLSPYDSLAFVMTELGDSHATSNHTRPSWIAMWGVIEGDTAGVAIISHPDNFRHPQPIRVHPTMPYFTFAPMFLGEFVLTPSEVYRARYRIVTYDGEPDEGLIRRLESEYGG